MQDSANANGQLIGTRLPGLVDIEVLLEPRCQNISADVILLCHQNDKLISPDSGNYIGVSVALPQNVSCLYQSPVSLMVPQIVVKLEVK